MEMGSESTVWLDDEGSGERGVGIAGDVGGVMSGEMMMVVWAEEKGLGSGDSFSAKMFSEGMMKDGGCVARDTFIPGNLQEPSYHSEDLGDKGLMGDV